ncbi:MAG TPA: tyrosine--tRNA ligase [Syntrophaceticus sp.]|uniref:Tyrosine--tRNA ligase n=1 Tax=Syntrophaceticus schinkii TaxID=499207 RepID=A0A0B7MK79_9FIRM|nr:tyrosine--tRNA ligase [Syntrophaceticus schinkii]HHY29410.1 tyrosine--tRNA ligase [Syntrophaceticus sp.]MDD2359302.1 tyrosine--tRNA ligase [Syntrophaceticus schinkii]MDD4262674.1 tyrosine--tRNA ligase [Syntrophaceticus schinkii]MDD4675462.1 tyrosine--tRNA ligase [Syntrophaceticus schinkii]CEO90440.1 Tyrosine--tRNA ligase [Syntrophaceticus schinkii]
MSQLVKDIDKQLEIIKRGIAEIIPEDELVKKLERSIKEDRPLKVKLGMDPTAPDIHLGHTVVLHKMRQLQELGHDVVLILGDFTGRIGDPSGRSETRRQLTDEEIQRNVATYKDQVGKILDLKRARLVYNSTWLGALSFSDVITLAAKYTVARMLERDDFERRYQEGIPIGIHEFLYPLMQGYDSVVLKADIELGGTDQKFNLMVGRDLQREFDQEPQVAITMPILEGLDGVQKMSKSLGNYIGISEPPKEIYGKTMSITDELIVRYYQLVTPVSNEEVKKIQDALTSGSLHPRDAKMNLARELVTMFYGNEAALDAEKEFVAVFQKGKLPDDLPEVRLSTEEISPDGTIWLPKLLAEAGLSKSTSAGKRFVAQGAVRIDGEKVTDPECRVVVYSGMIIQVGKRKFARIII